MNWRLSITLALAILFLACSFVSDTIQREVDPRYELCTQSGGELVECELDFIDSIEDITCEYQCHCGQLKIFDDDLGCVDYSIEGFVGGLPLTCSAQNCAEVELGPFTQYTPRLIDTDFRAPSRVNTKIEFVRWSISSGNRLLHARFVETEGSYSNSVWVYPFQSIESGVSVEVGVRSSSSLSELQSQPVNLNLNIQTEMEMCENLGGDFDGRFGNQFSHQCGGIVESEISDSMSCRCATHESFSAEQGCIASDVCDTYEFFCNDIDACEIPAREVKVSLNWNEATDFDLWMTKGQEIGFCNDTTSCSRFNCIYDGSNRPSWGPLGDAEYTPRHSGDVTTLPLNTLAQESIQIPKLAPGTYHIGVDHSYASSSFPIEGELRIEIGGTVLDERIIPLPSELFYYVGAILVDDDENAILDLEPSLGVLNESLNPQCFLTR